MAKAVKFALEHHLPTHTLPVFLVNYYILTLLVYTLIEMLSLGQDGENMGRTRLKNSLAKTSREHDVQGQKQLNLYAVSNVSH